MLAFAIAQSVKVALDSQGYCKELVQAEADHVPSLLDHLLPTWNLQRAQSIEQTCLRSTHVSLKGSVLESF